MLFSICLQIKKMCFFQLQIKKRFWAKTHFLQLNMITRARSPKKVFLIRWWGYYVFITKTLFGPGRVPNKTLTCIHNASETTFCAFFSPPWRPRGAPGLKTELPEGPEASQKAHQNPSKLHHNPLWSAMLCFRVSRGAPPSQKWSQRVPKTDASL